VSASASAAASSYSSAKVRRVDGEPELPVGQQRGGDDQAEYQCDQCGPAEAVKALGLHRRGAEKRCNESMGGQERAGALTDSSDDAVLIRESVATGLEDDLLKRGHVSRLRDAADGGPGRASSRADADGCRCAWRRGAREHQRRPGRVVPRKPIANAPDFLRRRWSLLHTHGRCDAGRTAALAPGEREGAGVRGQETSRGIEAGRRTDPRRRVGVPAPKEKQSLRGDHDAGVQGRPGRPPRRWRFAGLTGSSVGKPCLAGRAGTGCEVGWLVSGRRSR
jgi:hypothetical protein